MKTRKGKLLLLAASIAVVVVIIIATTPDEPEHKGAPIGAWIDVFADSFRKDRIAMGEAQEALAAVGPEAADLVMDRIALHDSPIHKQYVRFYEAAPGWFHRIAGQPRRTLTIDAGANAIHSMGIEVIPVAIDALEHRNLKIRSAAARALSLFLKSDQVDLAPAVPVLVNHLKNDLTGSTFALVLLMDMGPQAVSAVPDLIFLLKRSEDDFAPRDVVISQLWACNVLGSIGAPAVDAVPELIVLLESEVESIHRKPNRMRTLAAMTLGKLGTSAREALPQLTKMMEDPDAYNQTIAAISVWRIGGRVADTVPVLVAGFAELGPNLKGLPLQALEEMGPLAKDAVPHLRKYLDTLSTTSIMNRDPDEIHLKPQILKVLGAIESSPVSQLELTPLAPQ